MKDMMEVQNPEVSKSMESKCVESESCSSRNVLDCGQFR